VHAIPRLSERSARYIRSLVELRTRIRLSSGAPPGKKNQNADGLSRIADLPSENEDEDRIREERLDLEEDVYNCETVEGEAEWDA
jgi:hypothetical protein